MKPNAQELHPDVNTTDQPPAFHNYLDEFLQAVRVFGFLEKPVSVVGRNCRQSIEMDCRFSMNWHGISKLVG